MSDSRDTEQSAAVRIASLSAPILMMAVGSGWLADAMHGYFFATASERNPVMLGIIAAILFFGGAAWVYYQSDKYLPVRVLSKTDRIKPCRALVATISPMNFNFQNWPAEDAQLVIEMREKSHRLSGDMTEDIQPCGIDWNWQQLLRAVAPHTGKIDRIYLIGSSDKNGKKGSGPQLDICKMFLSRYVDCDIRCVPGFIDFEDIDAVKGEVFNAVEILRRDGYGDSEIMLDSTGGHKTASIAVALVTLNHPRLQFQYVSMYQIQPLAFNVVAERLVDLG